MCQTILKQNRLTAPQSFFSIETDEVRISQNCLALDNKKQIFKKKFLTVPLETIDL